MDIAEIIKEKIKERIIVKINGNVNEEWMKFKDDKIDVLKSLSHLSNEFTKKNQIIQKVINIFKDIDNLNDQIFDIDEFYSPYSLIITGNKELLSKLIDIGVAELINYDIITESNHNDDVLSDDVDYPDEISDCQDKKHNDNLFQCDDNYENCSNLNNYDEDDLDFNDHNSLDSDECLIESSFLNNTNLKNNDDVDDD
jgi:hypothetical protein